jgi:hypothetical protein
MRTMKRFFTVTGFGALICAALFAWFSPYVIVWYFSPPAELSISCSPAVQWGISTYRKFIFTGFLFGALLSTVAFFAFFRGNPAPSSAQVVPPNPKS